MNFSDDRFFSNEDYPRIYGGWQQQPAPARDLEVVSSCPRCGAPVYGPMTVTAREPVDVVFTCCCGRRRRRGD